MKSALLPRLQIHDQIVAPSGRMSTTGPAMPLRPSLGSSVCTMYLLWLVSFFETCNDVEEFIHCAAVRKQKKVK